MRVLELLFVAGAAAGAGYLWLGRQESGKDVGKPVPWPGVRIWPLPEMPDGRKPVISSGHKMENPSRPSHQGVDIMYPRLPQDAQKIGDGAGARRFIMPIDAPVVATESGIVQIAGQISTGWRLWVAHGRYRTGYFHLREIVVDRGQPVQIGMLLGTVGHNPAASDPLHLHFELSPMNKYAPCNPRPYLRDARVLAGAASNLWTSSTTV